MAHSLAFVGSRSGLQVPICSNELPVNWLPSQDLRCGGRMASAGITFAILSPFNHGRLCLCFNVLLDLLDIWE